MLLCQWAEPIEASSSARRMAQLHLAFWPTAEGRGSHPHRAPVAHQSNLADHRRGTSGRGAQELPGA
jgi:hypothetical protein